MSKKLKTTSNHKRAALILVAGFALIGASLLVFTKAAVGGTAAFTMSPATGTSVEINDNVTISLYENGGTGGDPVSAFDLRLTYDTAKLTFVSVNNTGSGFTDCFEKTGGSGFVGLVCSKLGGSLTGNQKIGEVVFTAKVGSGFTDIGIGSNSHIYKADGVPTDIWNGVTTGVRYNLITPDTTPPAVAITAPSAGATVQGSSVVLAANATDDSGTVNKVEFYVNGVLKNTDTLSPYTYTWDSTTVADSAALPIMVKAYDNAPTPNVGSSTVNVKVQNNKPNLSVSNITLSPASPKPGDVVTVSAAILNSGTAATVAGTSVTTSLSIDGGTPLTSVSTAAVAIGSTVNVNFTWTATRGAHSLLATADKTNTIFETNEADNNTTKNITVNKPGDVNNDNAVNSTDLAIFSFNYGKSGMTFAQGDFTGDGLVNSADVAILSFNWGK